MTFEPIDWPDEYELAADDDTDDRPSLVERFRRYLVTRRLTQHVHRDTDTYETERLRP